MEWFIIYYTNLQPRISFGLPSKNKISPELKELVINQLNSDIQLLFGRLQSFIEPMYTFHLLLLLKEQVLILYLWSNFHRYYKNCIVSQ